MACPLCCPGKENVLWQDEVCRVIWAEEPDYPGFLRVICKKHVAEMTDLSQAERMHLMQVVFAVEQALRELLKPRKINLASLGNKVAHLHWHVIARFSDDAHFPESVWSERQRERCGHTPLDFEKLAHIIDRYLAEPGVYYQ